MEIFRWANLVLDILIAVTLIPFTFKVAHSNNPALKMFNIGIALIVFRDLVGTTDALIRHADIRVGTILSTFTAIVVLVGLLVWLFRKDEYIVIPRDRSVIDELRERRRAERRRADPDGTDPTLRGHPDPRPGD